MSEIGTGPCLARPYMLGYRKDFGYSGMSEPDQLINMVQLIITNGFFGSHEMSSGFLFLLFA